MVGKIYPARGRNLSGAPKVNHNKLASEVEILFTVKGHDFNPLPWHREVKGSTLCNVIQEVKGSILCCVTQEVKDSTLCHVSGWSRVQHSAVSAEGQGCNPLPCQWAVMGSILCCVMQNSIYVFNILWQKLYHFHCSSISIKCRRSRVQSPVASCKILFSFSNSS